MQRTRFVLGGSAAVPVLLLALAGEAQAHRYTGPHPVDPGLVKGLCRIDGPHFHAYAPHKPLLYVETGGNYAFIGDPVEFEPDAPKYGYYGHHPVFWVQTPDDLPAPVKARHYCYIGGPHHHWYAPEAHLAFKLKGGVFWYAGPVPVWYHRRWKRRSPMDDHYRVVVLVRPVVAVAPPEGFVGVYFGAGVGYGGGVHVVAPPPPSVHVRVPAPAVGITIGGGGYYGGGGYVVAPGHHVKVKGGHGPPAHAPAHGYRGHGGGHGGGHGHGKGKWK